MDVVKLFEKLPPLNPAWPQHMQDRWLWLFAEILRMAKEQSGTVTANTQLVAVQCNYCDWSDAYDTPANAARALSSHTRQMHQLQISENGTRTK
jgi:hypothetical protein